MPWGNKTSLGTQTAVNGTTEEFLPSSGGITLNPGESCHLQLEVDNNSGSITDLIEIRIYTTLDASSEDWDDLPYESFSVNPQSVNARDIPHIVGPGPYKFRIGFLSSGSTDTWDVGGNYRKDGINLSPS